MLNRRTGLIVLVLAAFLFFNSAAKPRQTDKRAVQQARTLKGVSLGELRLIMTTRFINLHQAYLSQDASTYTNLLRATLRHARRLNPAQCVAVQGALVQIGNGLGYDGLEPAWLIYQDCAASGQSALVSARTANATLLKEGLRFRKDTLPQLPLRVSYWNSMLERGVRAEAARVVMTSFAHADPNTAQWQGLREMLRQRATHDSLCSLPLLKDQTGRVALVELLRQTQCQSGAGPNVKDLCDKLGKKADAGPGSESTTMTKGMSTQDKGRVQDFCSHLTGTGSPGSAGMDLLDNFSTESCNSEGGTRLYESEKIAKLVMDCYFSGEGNPLASGGTTADIGSKEFFNRQLEYKISDRSYGDVFTYGASFDEAQKTTEIGYGDTPEAARHDLISKLEDKPPPAYTEEKQADGSVKLTRVYDRQNEDGTSTNVDERHTVSPDGTTRDTIFTTNNDTGDGTFSDIEHNPDGSSTTIQSTSDKDHNSKSLTLSSTDKDGNTTRTKTEYNKDGTVKTRTTTTSKGAQSPSEPGGFDPRNSACQDLMSLDVMPGMGRSRSFDEMFKRPSWADPSKVNPRPDDAGPEWGQEPFCGAPSVAAHEVAAKCNSAQMCTEPGEYMDDSCKCKSRPSGQTPMMGCATASCAPGDTPVPVPPASCICRAGGGESSGAPPKPIPMPTMIGAFSELIWNRADGRLFMTQDIAHGVRQPPGGTRH